MQYLTAACALVLCTISLVAGSCSGGSDDSRIDAVTAATPGIPEVSLSGSHPGWRQAGCSPCHDDVHGNGMVEPGCVHCHGTNGAPYRPFQHATDGCAECHPAAHDGAAFNEPGECGACHVYEEMDGCPAEETYDVIVIGAGGGGMGAAARLARAGKRVVLLEKQHRLGGYMTTFRRGPYTFEVSLHAMGGLDDPTGGTWNTFDSVGIRDTVRPVKLDPMYRIVNPGFEMTVPADAEDFRRLLREQFPAEARNIDRFFEDLYESDAMFQELSRTQAAGGEEWDRYIESHMTEVLKLFGYMNATLTEVLDEYFTDQTLRLVITQLSSYAGTEPDAISAGFYLVMWFGYHFHGFYYFEGGSKALIDAMASVIRQNGGEIRLHTLVERIDVVDGRVTGVQTRNGSCYRAPFVVSNASALSTMLDMVGRDLLPADYVEAMNGMEIGLSGFVLYLGVDRDYAEYFQGAHEIFVNESADQHQNFAWNTSVDAELAPFLITNYSAADPSMAPDGKNAIVIAVELDYGWRSRWAFEDRSAYHTLSREVAGTILARAERILPGLTEHIEVMSIATPPTLEGFTLNPGGSFFGFHNPPENALLNRLPQETPVAGLYLAGAWTFPGPGQSAVISSGVSAAKLVLEAMEASADGDR